MTLNTVALSAALATFLGIWWGHVGVRKFEARSATLWPPTVAAVLAGIALEVLAASANRPEVAVAAGIFGMTLLFDALEFHRQHRRVAKGHAPANPANPRHARLLAEGRANPLDLLDRDPLGRPVSPEEAVALVSKGGRA